LKSLWGTNTLAYFCLFISDERKKNVLKHFHSSLHKAADEKIKVLEAVLTER
jgi:hypothetical protein